MSKITLEPNNSGSGTFTIAAPNSNNNRQIDLPDLAGTVLTNVSDLEPQVKTATNATGTAPIYACRAWVNFDGTGTVSIRDSGNVSSITDITVGEYQVNFTSAMPDANYCPQVASRQEVNNISQVHNVQGGASSSFNFSRREDNVKIDSVFIFAAVFR